MNRIKRLAAESPLVFSFTITFVFILLVLITSILVGARWPGETIGWYLGSTIGRLISIFILLVLLYLLGWLSPAGFTRLGRPRIWLIILLPLAYAIVVSAFAFTGNLDFQLSDPALTAAVTIFILTAAFMEEVAFRGLILHALVRAWGTTNSGFVKSVLVSSLFFGDMHMVNILGGQPLPEALLQGVEVFFLGVFLGALVIRSYSIYPAAFFHGILNLAGYLNLTANGAESSLSSWLMLSLLMIPLALFGLFALRGVRQRPMLPDAAY